MRSQWYLGFDCATKTFAYSLSRVNFDSYRAVSLELSRRCRAVRELLSRAGDFLGRDPEAAASILEKVDAIVADLDLMTSSYINIVAGATVDLVPGKPDKLISTVERIRSVVHYVRNTIRPQIEEYVPFDQRASLNVVVEFQMGPNSPSKKVAMALITLFADERVFIVGPSLKNKIATCEDGKYCRFAEKYSTTYGANKAHAIYNFQMIEAHFGTGIPLTTPPSLRGHIADSFMQVIGHIVSGEKNCPEDLF